jgi:putative intracellular protease/amidase
MNDTDQIRTVHLFVLDTLADWEVGYAIGFLNVAFGRALHRFRVATVGVKREPVTSVGGVTIVPSMTLAELEPSASAMLILPGAATWDQPVNHGAIAAARRFLDAGTPVAAICAATAALAAEGLLDNRRHTSNAPEFLNATGYKGGAHYVHERAVTDRDLITAGATGALELAHHIFLRLEYYSRPALESWYQAYRTGDPRYYAELLAQISPADDANRSIAR